MINWFVILREAKDPLHGLLAVAYPAMGEMPPPDKFALVAGHAPRFDLGLLELMFTIVLAGLLALQRAAEEVTVAEKLLDYVMAIVAAPCSTSQPTSIVRGKMSGYFFSSRSRIAGMAASTRFRVEWT